MPFLKLYFIKYFIKITNILIKKKKNKQTNKTKSNYSDFALNKLNDLLS